MQKKLLFTSAAFVVILWSAQAFAGITSVTRPNDTGNPELPEVVADGMAEDALSYTDRTHEWNSVPACLLGGDYIKSANDDRGPTNFGLEIVIDGPMTLAIMVDLRVDAVGNMPWLATDGWAATNVYIGVDEGGNGDINQSSQLYVKTFDAAGTVSTGCQCHGGLNNYGVCEVTDDVPDLAGHCDRRYIRARAWNYLVLNNPYGCGGGPDVIGANWVTPHDIAAEDPKAGDVWDDIDFDASPSSGWNIGGLAPNPTWLSHELIETALGAFITPDSPEIPGDSTDPNNGTRRDHSLQFQDIAVWLTDYVVPNVPGATAVPNDWVVGIATTYVNNVSGGPLEVQLCQGSDDGMATWVNNVQVSSVVACRGSNHCQELYPVVLPEGISQIRAQVYEEGGGWNLRLGLVSPATGLQLIDGNGLVEFLGNGAGDEAIVGQEMYSLSRDIVLNKCCNCPELEPVAVTLAGAGPGDDADLLTIVELVDSFDDAQVEITNVTNDGVADLIFPTPPPDPVAVGEFDDHRYVGFAPCLDGPDDNNTTYDAGTGIYTQTAAANLDIWNGGDSFTFAFNRYEGNFEISIKILTKGETGNNWNKIGLMARRDLVPCSQHYTVVDPCFSCGDIRQLQGRSNGGGDCGSSWSDNGFAQVGGVDVTAHCAYYRLTRRGDVIQGWVTDDAGVETEPTNDDLWGAANRTETWAGTDPLYVGAETCEHGGGTCGPMIMTFELLHTAGTKVQINDDPVPLHQTITWTDVARSDVTAGISYDVQSLVSDAVTLGPPVIVGERYQTPLVDSVNFDSTQGVVAEFDTHHDVGNVPTPGSASEAGGVYTISGTGGDIWDGGDHMHFVYKTQSGDFVATCRLVEIINPPNARWGRLGIMARQSCDFNSKYSMACVPYRGEAPAVGGTHGQDGNDTKRHQSRRDHLVNGTCREQQVLPRGTLTDEWLGWVRLVRTGNYMYSMYADDVEGEPGRWYLAGGDTWTEAPEDLLLGFVSGNHNSGGANLLTVSFDNWTVEEVSFPDLVAIPIPDTTIADDFEDETAGDPPSDAIVVDGIVMCLNDNGTPDDTSDDFWEPCANQFAPIVVNVGTAEEPNQRLRVTQDAVGGDFNAVYYPLADLNHGDGFVAEMDVFYNKPAGENPADGLAFVVFEGADPAEYAGLVGGAGGAMGWELGDHNAIPGYQRRKSFAVEVIDPWDGGHGTNDPPGSGTNSGPEGMYNVAIDVHQETQSAQNNLEFGTVVPDIYNSLAGAHVVVEYTPLTDAEARIDVYMADNDPVEDLRLMLSAIGPKLDGDLTLGFTSGTGGATANHEVDNVSITAVCVEQADGVAVSGDTTGEVGGLNAALAATFTGADGAVSFAWSVSAGATIVGPADADNVIVQCDAGGTVTATVTAGDELCDNTVDANMDIECTVIGRAMTPADYNQDGTSDMSDGIALLQFLFVNPAANPVPCAGLAYDEGGNLTLMDWNGDTGVDLSDAVALFGHLFLGQAAHVLGEITDCVLIENCDGEGTCEP